jgi:GT2 family glycosyltransferase
VHQFGGGVTPDRRRDPLASRVTVVIATRDRCASLLRTLVEIDELADAPRVVVVDNGSEDATLHAVARHFPHIRVIPVGRNMGACARNVGAAAATTPYVAFCDDDSWWAPGALELAVETLDRAPEIALVSARVTVGPHERPDETSTAMARSPLPGAVGTPTRGVLGFLACAAVVRRHPFLDVGGFDSLLFFLGEETKVAYDLAARGWVLVHLDDAVVHHHPDAPRDVVARRVRLRRNDLLTMVMRRPLRAVAKEVGALARDAPRDPVARRALYEALVLALPAWERRRPPSPRVERMLATLAADDQRTPASFDSDRITPGSSSRRSRAIVPMPGPSSPSRSPVMPCARIAQSAAYSGSAPRAASPSRAPARTSPDPDVPSAGWPDAST